MYGDRFLNRRLFISLPFAIRQQATHRSCSKVVKGGMYTSCVWPLQVGSRPGRVSGRFWHFSTTRSAVEWRDIEWSPNCCVIAKQGGRKKTSTRRKNDT